MKDFCISIENRIVYPIVFSYKLSLYIWIFYDMLFSEEE